MRRFLCCFIVLYLLCPRPALSQQPESSFKTKFAVVHYSDKKDMSDFIWRLGGQRIDFTLDTPLASNRIDRVVERVEAILDMRPRNFNVNIYLYRGPLKEINKISFYEHKSRSIHISVDYASDGVFAHEIAHAIVCQYFSPPPPSKMQEILTQYVDRYLWVDY